LKQRAIIIAAALAFLCGAQASNLRAAQQLLASPFPLNSGINSMDTLAPQPHYHQHLLPDAAPASLGPNALGNPEHLHPYRHQHLLRDPYPREYWER
jgi:hypothetical protein